MREENIILSFYTAFAAGDSERMLSCYHNDIIFSDPAFGTLQGEQAKNMWRMLLARSKGGLKISFANVKSNSSSGSADWTAEYVFAQTGRKVTNKISAEFTFKDGKIIRHTDHFDLWEWSQQALGWKGYLLGWSSFFKAQLQNQTRKLLKKYSKL